MRYGLIIALIMLTIDLTLKIAEFKSLLRPWLSRASYQNKPQTQNGVANES